MLHPKANGLSPSAATDTTLERKWQKSKMSCSGSTVVKHLPHHAKAKDLSLATAIVVIKWQKMLMSNRGAQWSKTSSQGQGF